MTSQLLRLSFIALCATFLMTGRAGGETIIDLTTPNSFGTANGAHFYWVDEQSTGTGVIKPFLRVQGKGMVEGYNTDSSTLEYQQKAGTWTHSLKLADIPVVNGYYQFLLDINQSKSKSLLSLHELVLYQGSNPLVHSFNKVTQVFNDDPTAYKAYDLDAPIDHRAEMDYALNSGSGQGDVVAYIPVSNFQGTGQYLYLYSAFGIPNPDNSGFEEWATAPGLTGVPKPPPIVPLPPAAWAGLSLIGAIFGVCSLRARRTAGGLT